MENSVAVAAKSTPLGGKIWTNALLFGLIGQIAWVVENMYFATFAQKLFEDGAKFGNMYYTATTLMVIFSAITATVTTIFMGGLCDKAGKRKPFITIGYLFWGATIMLFAAIPIDFNTSEGSLIIALLVIFDCIMTFAGSTANDAAFNAWVADVTDVTNRGKVNTILSIMPVIATVVTIVIAMFTFDKGDYTMFFIVLGIIPMVTGVLSAFMLKDAPGIAKNTNPNYFKETFYGFRPSVIKGNKMMYVCLSALCLIGIAQQTFMSYLISFVTMTLGITDYLVPLAVVIVLSAAITGGMGVLFDKFGRKNFYIPLVVVIVLGTLLVYLMDFMPQSAYKPVLYVGGTVMLGSMLCVAGALTAAFQDYIPKGFEGRFQGVRMCFTVLIPMIIGPIISLIIGINSFDSKDASATHPPFSIFLAAAIVALLAVIPIIFVRKDADRLRSSLLAKTVSRPEPNDGAEDGCQECAEETVHTSEKSLSAQEVQTTEVSETDDAPAGKED